MSETSASSTGFTVTQGANGDTSTTEFILRPYVVIVANLPDPTAKTYAPLGAYIRDYLDADVQHVISFRKVDHSSGHAVIHFGSSPAAYKVAMRLHQIFKKAGHGKEDLKLSGYNCGPYLWLATTGDDRWLRSYAREYIPCIVSDLWTAEAFKDAEEATRDVYRAIKRFTVRFAYATFEQLAR